MPERHELSFTISGKNASELEAAALQRVQDYAGEPPVRWTIEAYPLVLSGAGEVLTWEGNVHAVLGGAS